MIFAVCHYSSSPRDIQKCFGLTSFAAVLLRVGWVSQTASLTLYCRTASKDITHWAL